MKQRIAPRSCGWAGLLAWAALGFVPGAGAGAGAWGQDKAGYHLFNPVPREQMRDLSADRPDTTESPITVDAGHFQLEASLVDYSYDREDGDRTRAWTFFDANFKAGLTNTIDLQVAFPAYVEEEFDPKRGSSETLNGFGDVTLRLKVNLWGNDGGDTAFGIMPFITVPTGTEISSDHVEGGFIAMFGWDVAENWGLGFMAEIDAVYDDDDDSYDAEFVHSVVLGVDVVGPLGAFFEYAGVLSSDADTEYQAQFITGLTYAVNANLVLDAGTRIGLNNAAEDLGLFAGFTFRY